MSPVVLGQMLKDAIVQILSWISNTTWIPDRSSACSGMVLSKKKEAKITEPLANKKEGNQG